MKRITISGQIIPEHWWDENEVTEQDVIQQLATVEPGEDAEIYINSPGGDVFTAIAIFNHIRDFAKTHKVVTVMNGIVGSAASYIALAAKAGNPESKIKAFDNSIFFIHNAQAFAYGDYHEMERMAGLTKSISDLICDSAYAKVSCDTPEKIHAAMDAETYYFGKEIFEHGYADEIEGIPDEGESDKNQLIAQAKIQYKNCMNHIKQWCENSEENEKIAANLSNSFMAKLPKIKNKTNIPAGSATSAAVKTEETNMDVAELKAKYPDVYNSVFAEGENKERSRVSAHLKMAADSGDISASVDFIKNGTPVSADEVTAKYHEVFCKTQLQAARLKDNTPAIATPGADKTDVHAEALAHYKKLMLGGGK